MLSVLPLPSSHIVLAHIYPGVYSGPIINCIYHAGSHIQVGEVVYSAGPYVTEYTWPQAFLVLI